MYGTAYLGRCRTGYSACSREASPKGQHEQTQESESTHDKRRGLGNDKAIADPVVDGTGNDVRESISTFGPNFRDDHDRREDIQARHISGKKRIGWVNQRLVQHDARKCTVKTGPVRERE